MRHIQHGEGDAGNQLIVFYGYLMKRSSAGTAAINTSASDLEPPARALRAVLLGAHLLQRADATVAVVQEDSRQPLATG
jgi:hypothetical protein